MTELASALSNLDLELRRAEPDKAKALRPGATPKAMVKLSNELFGGGAVPEDLTTWFRWHDGQQGFASLSPDDNRMLMSIDEVVEVHELLNDPEEQVARHWRRTWIPMLSNGAGDYLVLETEGKNVGALLAYWHTDDDRKVAHASLVAWAKATEAALAKLPAKTETPAPRQLLLAKKAPWEEAKKPTKKELSQRPVGTVFRFEHVPVPQGAPPSQIASSAEPEAMIIVLAKLDEGAWTRAIAPNPKDAAFAVNEHTKRSPPGTWKLDDAAAYEVFSSMSRWDGKKDKKHNELFEAVGKLGK